MNTVPTYKIALLGDGAVGKTSLRHRFLKNLFDKSYMMTIGADFTTKTVDLDGQPVKLQIWDLAGQPRFESIRDLYYRGSLGALVLFDVTAPNTYKNIPNWVRELLRGNGKGFVPIVLLGNKIDLRSTVPNSILPEQGQILAEEISRNATEEFLKVPYLETSAKTGENVDRAFTILAQKVTDFVKNRIGGPIAPLPPRKISSLKT
ncbi:MAG: GTP-binding protein [Candidatus Hodarchaeales archaeon]|jgi:small GTP-binding protein